MIISADFRHAKPNLSAIPRGLCEGQWGQALFHAFQARRMKQDLPQRLSGGYCTQLRSREFLTCNKAAQKRFAAEQLEPALCDLSIVPAQRSLSLYAQDQVHVIAHHGIRADIDG